MRRRLFSLSELTERVEHIGDQTELARIELHHVHVREQFTRLERRDDEVLAARQTSAPHLNDDLQRFDALIALPRLTHVSIHLVDSIDVLLLR